MQIVRTPSFTSFHSSGDILHGVPRERRVAAIGSADHAGRTDRLPQVPDQLPKSLLAVCKKKMKSHYAGLQKMSKPKSSNGRLLQGPQKAMDDRPIN
jgi:hypothetical protein